MPRLLAVVGINGEVVTLPEKVPAGATTTVAVTLGCPAVLWTEEVMDPGVTITMGPCVMCTCWMPAR